MAFDPNKVPAGRRAGYVKVGRQYGSSDTLAQAGATGAAYEKYGDLLREFGYVKVDADALTSYEQALIEAGVGRESSRAGAKQTSATMQQALAQGKQARLVAKTVLVRVEREMHDQDPAQAAELSGVLRQIGSVGEDVQELFAQLSQLEGQLRSAKVAAVAKSRGGPQALARITAALSLLAAARGSADARLETRAATELLDLIDGLIIENVRDARRAARAAGQALGRPELARAFELQHLYKNKSASAPPAPPTPVPA